MGDETHVVLHISAIVAALFAEFGMPSTLICFFVAVPFGRRDGDSPVRRVSVGRTAPPDSAKPPGGVAAEPGQYCCGLGWKKNGVSDVS